jgi:acetyl esterase/lipase
LYGDPTGLPPTLILVGSDEILHDDAVRMADNMRRAQCRVELAVWHRMPHSWPLLAPVVPESRAAIAAMGAFIEREAGGRSASKTAGHQHQKPYN